LVVGASSAWRSGERAGWLRLAVSMTFAGAANGGLWYVLGTAPGFPRIMYWPVIVAAAVFGAASVPVILWWSRRYRARVIARLPPMACTRCGYDRAGLPPGARCPECGQA
jgi:hypothetical protein